MVDSNSVTVKKDWFILDKKDKIEDYYDGLTNNGAKVGEGSFGQVLKITHKQTKEMRAVKIIPKARIKNPDKFKSEIEILRNVDHPNIIKLYETFEDKTNIYLVMELCTGGELFDRIIAKGHFTEDEARDLFGQIMRSMYYLHKHKISHRDLKPENFLYLNNKPDSPIKMIDFGLSRKFMGAEEKKEKSDDQFTGRRNNRFTTKVGTPYYIAPEVLQGNYDESCDIWSAGVLLYILLCGYPPFYGKNDNAILASVRKGVYDFEGKEWKTVSESAKDLIRHMICPPEKRLTAEGVLHHEWMKSTEKKKESLSLNFNTLKSFVNSEKLKKVALTYIATQLSGSEIEELAKLFQKLDTNGDGVLSLEEMQAGLKGLSHRSKDIEEIMKNLDTDKSGEIDYTEFIAATMEANLYLKEERLAAAFRMFDKDGDGKITAEELMEVLEKEDGSAKKDKSYYQGMIKECDKNGDGAIDYNEFIEMMGYKK